VAAWAKREEQIHGVVESTAGLYGDLQGIAGDAGQGCLEAAIHIAAHVLGLTLGSQPERGRI
jgi:hypothetical protein